MVGRTVWVDLSGVTYVHNLCRDCWCALAAEEQVAEPRRWQRAPGSFDFYARADGETMRMLLCDFCGIKLRQGRTYKCPAASFDYDEPRVALRDGAVLEGSHGDWLACPDCVALIRSGDREALAERGADRALDRVPIPSQDRGELRRTVLLNIRRLQDNFWANRRGQPTGLRPGEFEKIEREPAYDAEWRPST